MFTQLREIRSRLKQVSVSVEERRLRPAFLFLGEAVAGNVVSVSACSQFGNPILDLLRARFGHHSCALQLWREFQGAH